MRKPTQETENRKGEMETRVGEMREVGDRGRGAELEKERVAGGDKGHLAHLCLIVYVDPS